MAERMTQGAHVAAAYPDGAPAGLVPVRLVPVEVFGADECDACGAPGLYGLMDAVSAYSDCNRAYGRIYRCDEESSPRASEDVIVVWVAPDQLPQFDRVFGES